MQQVEKKTALDAEPVRGGMQVGVAQIEDGTAGGGAGFEADDFAAACQRAAGKTESGQHGKARRLKQKPRTDRAGLCKSFEDGDRVAGLGQQRGGGLAGDAASDDADLQETPFKG